MAGSAEKRPRDGAGSPPAEGRRSKRRRWDSDAPPADPPPAPTAPPAAAAGAPAAAAGNKLPDTSALAKAKAVLAKQKALAEKLKKLKRPETAPTAPQSDAVRRALEVAERARAARGAARGGSERRAAAATATTAAPRALLLNDRGEEVDEEGNVLEPVRGGGVKAVSTFKVNAKSSEERRKVDKLEAFAALQRETAAEVAATDEAWMDPSVIGRRRGRKAEFQVRARTNERNRFLLALPALLRFCFFSTKNLRATDEGRRRASFQSPAAAATRTDRRGDYWMRHRPFGAARRGFGRSPNRAAPRRHTFCVFVSSQPQVTLCREDARFSLQFLCLPYERLGVGKADATRRDGRDPFARATFLRWFSRRGDASLGRPRPAADEVR